MAVDRLPAPTIAVSVETIGPEEARAILGANLHNRHLRPTRVARYARDIAAGEWVLNGETIKVASSGGLIDGQHRLLAVVQADASAQFMVVRGLPDSTQETVDIGDKRSLGDVLTLRGEKSANNLAAALVTAFRVSQGTLSVATAWPTNVELLDWLDENPSLRDSIRISTKAQSNALRYPPSQAAALHYVMSKAAGLEAADAFWSQLFDGVDLDPDSPVLVLRNALIRELGERRRSRVVDRLSVTVKAWNAVREGRETKAVRWPVAGERFPAVK